MKICPKCGNRMVETPILDVRACLKCNTEVSSVPRHVHHFKPPTAHEHGDEFRYHGSVLVSEFFNPETRSVYAGGAWVDVYTVWWGKILPVQFHWRYSSEDVGYFAPGGEEDVIDFINREEETKWPQQKSELEVHRLCYGVWRENKGVASP